MSIFLFMSIQKSNVWISCKTLNRSVILHLTDWKLKILIIHKVQWILNCMSNNTLKLRSIIRSHWSKHLNFLMSSDSIVWDTSKYVPIDKRISLDPLKQFSPNIRSCNIPTFVFSEFEMFIINPTSQIKQITFIFSEFCILNTNCNLTITTTPQTPIVDIGWPTNCFLVVHDH